MKIISKFKDYYDGVAQQYHDPHLIYKRFEKIHHIEVKKFQLSDEHYFSSKRDILVASFIIGFCNKIYPGVHLRSLYNSNEKHCYSLDEVDKFHNFNFGKSLLERDYYNLKNKRYSQSLIYRSLYERYFKYCINNTTEYVKYFNEYNCPIWVYTLSKYEYKTKYSIKINTKLSNYEFYRIIEPWTAFQELNMYLGGLASPEKEIPKISDKDMVEIKGFDKKYSFRNRPKQ